MRDKKELLIYNSEGYYDPTAGNALQNVLRGRPNGFVRWMGQPIYLSPGDTPLLLYDNHQMQRFSRYAAAQGAHPLAPMMFYANVFDVTDLNQVKLLLRWTREWCKRASEIWVLGDAPMPELRWDIKQALKHGKIIRFFSEDAENEFRQIRMIDGSEEPPETKNIKTEEKER